MTDDTFNPQDSALDPVSVGFDPAGLTRAPTDDEMDRAIASERTENQRLLNQGMAYNPDDAAEAGRIAADFNHPPQAVLDNLDEFRTQKKQQLAGVIVDGNPALANYINSTPLASAVSSDDWGNLDKYTTEAQGTAGFFGAMDRFVTQENEAEVKGLQAAGSAIYNSIVPTPEEYQKGVEKYGPIGAQIVTLGTGLVNAPFAAFNGLSAGASAALVNMPGFKAIDQFMNRGIERSPEAAQAELGEDVNTALMGVGQAHEGAPWVEQQRGMAEAGAHNAQLEYMQGAVDAAKPWTDAGLEPPVGVHPLLDELKANMNAAVVMDINTSLANAVSTFTRERDPAMFRQTVEAQFGNTKVTIGGDAALALYGDKAPAHDDGLLGWVPGIEDQLKSARDTNEPVEIALKDWLSYVDPAVATQLSPHMAVRPGWLTEVEAAARDPNAVPPKFLDAALAQVRGAFGLEPKFAQGDRPLELRPKLSVDEGDDEAVESAPAYKPQGALTLGQVDTRGAYHSFDIYDGAGVKVGDLELNSDRSTDGKGLWVEWVGGTIGNRVNGMGPALVMGVREQIKAMFPDKEYIAGFRVGGARNGRAARENLTEAQMVAKVRLAADDGAPITQEEFEAFKDILATSWQRVEGTTLEQRPVDEASLSPEHQAVLQAFRDEAAALTGGRVSVTGTAGLRDAATGTAAKGAVLPLRNPMIFMDLLRGNQGTLRHEAVHALRGLLSDGEWAALEQGAAEQGWGERFGVDQKYSDLDQGGRTEEAVAEGFREWMGQDPALRPKTGWGAVFQKIADFFERVRMRLGEAFGHEPTWEEVFERIKSGEVGRRTGGRGDSGGTKLATDEPVSLTGAAVGMNKEPFGTYNAALEAQHAADIKKAQELFEKKERAKQTVEWKQNEAAVRQQVSQDISARPDIAVDQFIGQGMVNGNKLRQRYTLAADELTEEQKAALPAHYYSKNGMSPDTVAMAFGFTSRQAMIDALARVRAEHVTPDGKKIRNEDYIRGLVKAETTRRMEERYGQLEGNILKAAQEHSMGQRGLDVVYEDYKKAAADARTNVIDKEIVRQAAKDTIKTYSVSKANSYRIMQQAARWAKAADEALVTKDYKAAADAMQRRTLLSYLGKEAHDVEEEVKAAKQKSKYWAKRDPKSIDPEYTNWIHQIMNQIGLRKVKRTPEDLARQQEYRGGPGDSLKDFTEREMNLGVTLAPDARLYDPQWTKEFNDLTVDEFRGANGFLTSLVKAGRDSKKFMMDGKLRYADEIRPKLVEPFERFGFKLKQPKDTSFLKMFYVYLQGPEFVMDRLDAWSPGGAWNRLFLNPLNTARGEKLRRLKSVSEDIGAIQSRPGWMEETIENPGWFRERQTDGGALLQLTRENLMKMAFHTGTESNFKALADGFGIGKEDRGILEQWIHSQMRPEDWKFVRSLWDAFKRARDWSDQMYLAETGGVPMQWVEGRRLFDGTMGSYAPITYDRPVKNHGPLSTDAIFGPHYETGLLPWNGYTIERTKPGDRLSLSFDDVPQALTSQIHDATMRPALNNARKILQDPEIEAMMRNHLGPEYNKMMTDFLKRAANGETNSQNAFTREFNAMTNLVTKNLITSYIGFNVGTFEKHTPTAMITSIAEVGPKRFFKAMRMLYQTNPETGESWNKFLYDNFDSIQERDRANFGNVFGTLDDVRGRITKYQKLQDQIAHASVKHIMLGDLLSSKPLALAMYMKGMEEGLEPGDAIEAANKAVRKAHGSTSEMSKSMINSTLPKIILPFFNFFNDVFNRTLEGVWKAGASLNPKLSPEAPATFKLRKDAAVAMFIGLVVVPAIEQYVDPSRDKKRTWGQWAAAQMLGPARYIPLARDFVSYMVEGRAPSIGMADTSLKDVAEPFREVYQSLGEHKPNKYKAEAIIKSVGALLGATTGIPGHALGNLVSAGYGTATGLEHPRSLSDYVTLLRRGTLRGQQQ